MEKEWGMAGKRERERDRARERYLLRIGALCGVGDQLDDGAPGGV